MENDERYKKLQNEQSSALSQSNSVYDTLINDTSGYYDKLIQSSKDYATAQSDLQNQQTELAIQELKQSQEKEEKAYQKEQAGAYADYLKQANAYGAEQQEIAEQGLAGSGWSETARSGFYNTYQNRISQARESYAEIVQNYNNNVAEARLQNSSALMNIYYTAQQEQLELALNKFNLVSEYTLSKQSAARDIESDYYSRFQDLQDQINYENELAAQSYSTGSSSSGSYSGNSYLTEEETQNATSEYANPYTGTVNSDTQYGTFSNGYQPDNINNVKLKKSGMTVAEFLGGTGNTNGLGKNIDSQNVWKIGSKYYIWDGSENKYVDVTNKKATGGLTTGGGGKGAKASGGGGSR